MYISCNESVVNVFPDVEMNAETEGPVLEEPITTFPEYAVSPYSDESLGVTETSHSSPDLIMKLETVNSPSNSTTLEPSKNQ